MSGRSPEVCVISCRTVMFSFPSFVNSGMYFRTKSSRFTWPRSTSSIIAGVQATTFVSEAASKIVSSVIGSTAGTTARLPKAL